MEDPKPSQIMLEAVRGFHARARQVLAKSKPDKAAAKRLMQDDERRGRPSRRCSISFQLEP